MLTYFPAPYPDEWWYSVLCRYHVRSGRRDAAVTLQELYGTRPLLHAKLFPGIDQYGILRQIPGGVFSLENLLLKHTLLPYYVRFASFRMKYKRLNKLLVGKHEGIPKFQTQAPNGKQGLKFCPICYAKDEEVYGEPYWHREHQIPLMPLCPKHKCRLCFIEISFSDLEEKFVPLYGMPNKKENSGPIPHLKWEPMLADALNSILTMPFEVSLPLTYNNIENVLESDKFCDRFISKTGVFDMIEFRRYCFDFYGKEIGEQYFAGMKNFRWNSSLPERYALLAVVAEITIEELFGPEIQTTNLLLEKLLEYRTVDIGKSELARQLGISQYYINFLARKYSIEPFWNSNRQCEEIQVRLSEEEKQCIATAAVKSGAQNVGSFVKKILINEVDRILSSSLHG